MSVTTIESLLLDPDRRRYAGKPEMDPLTEERALADGCLVSVRSDLLTATVSVLFDLRSAEQLQFGNTAVIRAWGVTLLTWKEKDLRSFGYRWHAVDWSYVDNVEGRFRLRMPTFSFAELSVEATSAEFFMGDMPHLDVAPPDFVEDSEEVIRAGMPQWDSPFIPLYATFLDPYEGD